MKKRIFASILAVVLCVALVLSLSACDGLKKLDKQADILTELRSKSADIGIMDSIMAGYYESTSDDISIIKELKLSDEFYGIAFRKGSKALVDEVNTALSELYADGKLLEIAKKYGVEESLIEIKYTSVKDTLSDEDKADLNYIKNKGNIKLGYTKFAPIAYESNGKLIGFDIELAEAVFAKLGITLVTELINWDTKEIELNAKNLDCIWNGLSITEKRSAAMEISVPYLKNSQVAVIRTADVGIYTSDMATFKDAIIVAEKASAGADAYKDVIKPFLKKLKAKK